MVAQRSESAEHKGRAAIADKSGKSVLQKSKPGLAISKQSLAPNDNPDFGPMRQDQFDDPKIASVPRGEPPLISAAAPYLALSRSRLSEANPTNAIDAI